MTATKYFYKDLPPVTSFFEVLKPANHIPVPADWSVSVTDVIASTKAIEAGKYKDVNTAGALAAMAISNINKDMDFPFIFGGDGITCLVPPDLTEAVKDVLFDTKIKVLEFFGLDLRVGLIPVSHLYQSGYKLAMAKFKVSAFYNQAILSGDGLEAAEQWIKMPDADNNYLIRSRQDAKLEANFDGFTCRWEDIPSTKGETISTIIRIRNTDAPELLPAIMEQMYRIFGKEEEFKPISAENLHISLSENELGREAMVMGGSKSRLIYFIKLWQFKFEAFVTRLALRFGVKVKVNWYDLRKLKDYQIASTDYKKFDGSLKIVMDCTTAARQEWQAYLESLYQQAAIFYGIHIADRAIITCLLHAGSSREVHFIDGADGGYALAARQLKKQMATTR